MDLVASGFITSWNFLSDTAPRWFQSWYTTTPTIEDTIVRLEHVRQQVSDREESLRQKLKAHHQNALQFAKQKQVREARVQIRLRLLYDRQVLSVQKILTAIESHLVAIQSALLNREVFLALHDSSKALGKGSIKDDAFADVLDRLDEQHSATQEIMDIISTQPLDCNALSDDDIDQELKNMMSSPHTPDEPPTLPDLPVPPTNSLLEQSTTPNTMKEVGDCI